MINIQTHIMQ